jgi:hypothetical protein
MVSGNNGYHKVVSVVPMLIMPCHFQAAVAVSPRQHQCPEESASTTRRKVSPHWLVLSTRPRCGKDDVVDVGWSSRRTEFQNDLVCADEQFASFNKNLHRYVGDPLGSDRPRLSGADCEPRHDWEDDDSQSGETPSHGWRLLVMPSEAFRTWASLSGSSLAQQCMSRRDWSFIGSFTSLLSVRRSHTDVNPACRSEREAHVPLVETTIAASTIWFVATAVSSSLGSASVCDHFDLRISG